MRASILSAARALGLVLTLVSGMLFAPGTAGAALPETLNYQGRMTSGGAPIPDSSGNTVQFRLCLDAGCASPVWSETWDNGSSHVSTKNGLFNVALGSYSSLSAIAFDQPYWLEVQWTNLSGTPEVLLPRQPLTSAPYAFRAKSVGAPLNLNGTLPGAVISGSNGDSVGVGVRGIGSPGFGNSTGIEGQGGRGVVGTSTGSGGIGVLAQQGSGAHALRVSGNAEFNAMTDFLPGSTVDFTGATVMGLATGVPVPLSLTGNDASAAIVTGVNQNATGIGVAGMGQTYGLSGTATLGGTGVGVLGQAASTSGAGVYGLNPAGIGVHGDGVTGVYAHGSQYGVSVTASGASATGVIAMVSSNTYAMRAINNGGGFGLLGTGLTGVAGVAPFANAIGVLASSNGQANAVALKVSGPASFSGSVDFSAATVSGLPTVQPPVSWLTPSASPVLSVENTGTGQGLLARGVQVGISATATDVNFGRAIYAQTNPGGAGDITTAEFRRSGNGTGAALRAFNTGTAGGAPGIQASSSGALGVAVNGLVDAVGNTGYGIRGENNGSGNLGAGVYGENGGTSNTGYGVYGANWPNIGVYGLGRHGVVGRTNNSNGTGVLADWNNIAGSMALKVSGPARFDMGSVTFASHVDFSGATVTGLPVTAPPVNWTLSHGLPILTVSNTGAGRGLSAYAANDVAIVGQSPNAAGVVGVGVAGYGVYAQSDTNAALFASSTAAVTSAAVIAESYGPGAAILASGSAAAVSATVKNSGAAAVYAYSDFNGPGTTYGVRGISRSQAGYGVHGENQTPSGVGVYGMGGYGVWGEPSWGTGTGVEARQGVGTWALSVSGAARFQYGPVNFGGNVDFSGATVTGLALNVTAPLSLTLSALNASPLSVSNASGTAGLFQGVTAVSAVGSSIGISVTSGVGGRAAIYATSNNTFGSGGGGVVSYNYGGGTAFYGQGTGNYVVWGEATGGGGAGLFGTGNGANGRGVQGRAFNASGYGVLAENYLAGGVALKVSGGAQFYGSTTFTGHADFSGATVTGLPLGGGPLSVTAAIAHPGAVFYATNSGTGNGVYGEATKPGWGGAGATITAGVYGYSSQSLSAGVLARNTFAGLQAAGVYADASNAFIGESNFPGGAGGDFKGNSGTGVKARGVTAVAANSTSLDGLGARIVAYSVGSRALEVEGTSNLYSDNSGYALSVTQASNQYGAGAIMAFAAASGTAAIRALNTDNNAPTMNTIPGVGVWSEGSIGVAAFATHNEGMGLYAQAGGSTQSAAIRAEQMAGGTAVEAESNSGRAVYARGVTGLAAFSYTPGGVGVYAYGIAGSQALQVDGESRFNYPGSSNWTMFNGNVDFSGATVTGLSGGGGVPNPLVLSNSGITPVIEAYANSINGIGIRGWTMGEWGAGVDAVAQTINATAIRAQANNGSTGMSIQATGGGRGIVVGTDLQRAIEANSSGQWTQVIQSTADGYGATAVEARGNSSNSTGLRATAGYADATALRAENFLGGRALDVQGGSNFWGSTTFTGSVDFTGATVTGLASGGVPNPLSLTNNIAGAVAEFTNTWTGPALAVQGESVAISGAANAVNWGHPIYGLSITARNSLPGNFQESAGVLGQVSSSAWSSAPNYVAGVIGRGHSDGSIGVMGQVNSNGATAFLGRALNGGLALDLEGTRGAAIRADYDALSVTAGQQWLGGDPVGGIIYSHSLGSPVGLSVAARSFQNVAWVRPVGAAISAIADSGEAVGLSVTARSNWNQGRGIQVYAQRSLLEGETLQGVPGDITAVNITATAMGMSDSVTGVRAMAMANDGQGVALHAVVSRTAGAMPLRGIGVLAESAGIGIKAVSYPDAWGSSGVALVAQGRKAAQFEAIYPDWSNPIIGASVVAVNSVPGSAAGAVGLSVTARNEWAAYNATGISATASLPNGGMGLAVGVFGSASIDTGGNGAIGVYGSSAQGMGGYFLGLTGTVGHTYTFGGTGVMGVHQTLGSPINQPAGVGVIGANEFASTQAVGVYGHAPSGRALSGKGFYGAYLEGSDTGLYVNGNGSANYGINVETEYNTGIRARLANSTNPNNYAVHAQNSSGFGGAVALRAEAFTTDGYDIFAGDPSGFSPPMTGKYAVGARGTEGGVVASASAFNGIGVYGENFNGTGIHGMGQGGAGNPGVKASSSSVSSPGNPAYALDIEGGISYDSTRSGGADVPAGTIGGITGTTGNALVNNDQYVPGQTQVLTTYEFTGGTLPADGMVFVEGVGGGQFRVRWGNFPATHNGVIHYFLINPR